MIPYGRQSIDNSDIESVIAVLRSDFITQGPVVPRFESSLAAYCGAEHAVAVNSATSALHVACLALGVGPGDIVWTSPITFVASTNCALYCGADIDFVDIDPLTFNMSPTALEAKLELAEQSGRLPKVVIPVHLCGQSCDMRAIHQLAKRYGFRILEDAAHAVGGTYSGKPIGSCEFSDIASFSFHPVKIITTAEGGMTMTNNSELAERMRLFRSHGITRDPARMVHASHGPWYYEQVALGFNYRLTDLQAALGLNQLARIDAFVERRHVLARRYDDKLSGLPVVAQRREANSGRSSLHLYVVRLDIKHIARSHRSVHEALRNSGIGVNLHYIPVYLQPYYANLGFEPGHCPEAERYYGEALSLPLYPDLSERQQDDVVAALKAAIA